MLLLLMLLTGGIADQETSVGTSRPAVIVHASRAVINVCSLCNKVDEFRVCSSDHNIDTCCVTDTRMNNSIPDSLAMYHVFCSSECTSRVYCHIEFICDDLSF